MTTISTMNHDDVHGGSNKTTTTAAAADKQEAGGVGAPSSDDRLEQSRQPAISDDYNDAGCPSEGEMRPHRLPPKAQPVTQLKCLHHTIFILTLITLQSASHGLQHQTAKRNWTSFGPPAPLPFASNRYIYPRSSLAAPANSYDRRSLNAHYRYDILQPTTTTTTTTVASSETADAEQKHIEIVALRDQLMEMKRKFENQLTASSSSRQVTLGSACVSSRDCSSRIANSHCRLDNYTCSCLANHVEYNSTSCLPSALLGFKCSIDSQCEQRVANSFCSTTTTTNPADNSSSSNTSGGQRVCSCKSNFIAYRRDKCLPGSRVNEYCLSNEQCSLNDKHSYCQWRIPNIYGTCKCPPNYKLLASSSSAAPTSGLLASNNSQQPAAPVANGVRCVPRLGDVCLGDDECQLATSNSRCQEEQAEILPLAAAAARAWTSSRATSRRRCSCQPGFVVSSNRLDCLPPSTTLPLPPPLSSIASLDTDLSDGKRAASSNFTSDSIITIVTLADTNTTTTRREQQPQYDLVTVTSAPAVAETTTKTTTRATTTTVIPEARISSSTSTGHPKASPSAKISSLGKKCHSSAECQARDLYSDCIGGTCECLRPTSRCQANATGCHGDTFQCRNGQCISWYFVCDQFRNCADGSDEDECQWSDCPPEAFQCSNGQCLARSKVCNGKRDCSDGSDELSCLPAASVTSDTQPPIGGGSGSHNNNSHTKPADWLSPEAGVARNWPSSSLSLSGCPAKAFTCSNGQCLPGYVFCNAVQDCSDGSDEREQLCERLNIQLAAKQDDEQDRGEEAPATKTTAPAKGKGGSSLGLSKSNTLPVSVGSSLLSKEQQQQQQQLKQHQQQQQSNSQLEDSPLVKADRLDINKMLASLNRQQQQQQQLAGAGSRRSRLLTDSARRRQQHQQQQQQQQQQQRKMLDQTVADLPPAECPRGSFTCTNGKCRSTAILCSGVDGCGDNSDENKCEVCQCEAP